MGLLDKIKGNMSDVETFLSEKVPGYSGYKQKEMRREADKILRETIASRMRHVKSQLDSLQQVLISAGKYHLLTKTGSTATQIQTFIDRVRTAAYGYGGLFDAERVDEDKLDRLYEFDAALMDYVDRIQAAIDQALDNIDGDIDKLVTQIQTLAREANSTFDERREYIAGTQDL